jgi:hypothetical protein
MSRYNWTGINTGTLPSHCERIANYWATLVCFDEWASGKAAAMKYKAVRAFTAGLRARGLSEKQISQAYIDTLELARLKKNADSEKDNKP